MGTNHFGHFLLTNLLLDKLKASAPSRIVVISSILHRNAGSQMDLNDLSQDNRRYDRYRAYGYSKLCNVLMVKELAKQLEGSGVAVNALHPVGLLLLLW